MLQFPAGTGVICELVGVPEHRARNLIRSGRLSVPCVGGRRMWFGEHALALAKIVGLDTPEVRNAIIAASKPATGIRSATAMCVRPATAAMPQEAEVAHANGQ